MVSALLISREVFSFLPSTAVCGLAGRCICSVLIGGLCSCPLHLGIHWNVMLGMACKLCKAPSRPRRIVLRVVGACIALYGIYALINRNISEYLFLQTQFVFSTLTSR